jgi:hypothetical protein
MKMVRSKVAGVSYANDDGSSRQRIIHKYCRAGKSLDVRLEPDNRYSDDAMGLWVRGRWLLIFPARYQVGYIKNEIATQIREDVVRGCPISVRITEVTGGGWFRKPYYGVNIQIVVGAESSTYSERRADRRSAPKRTRTSSTVEPPSSPRRSAWSSLKSGAAKFLSSFARRVSCIASDLAAQFRALPFSQKFITSGFSACCIGVAIWSFGYFVDKPVGLFSALRPIGVVTIIVGLGVFCLGTVFHFTESTSKPTE